MPALCQRCHDDLPPKWGDPLCTTCGKDMAASLEKHQAAKEARETWVSSLVKQRDARFLVLERLMELEPEVLKPYMPDVAIEAAMRRVVVKLGQVI